MVKDGFNRWGKDGFNRWLKMVSIDGVKMVLAVGFKVGFNRWLKMFLKVS